MGAAALGLLVLSLIVRAGVNLYARSETSWTSSEEGDMGGMLARRAGPKLIDEVIGGADQRTV